MKTALYVLLVIICLAMIVAIMLQPSKNDGLNNLLTGNSDTFFSKNKARTKEVVLARLTMVLGACLAAVVLALNLVK
ncbi:preprotein translocase subunit SecG [Clostridium cellulovorans]|uniref:Protein-export membrane protein SecG n=1 Tax=Clostridium cellulovorans (strain ATCC 35296 / DSM 3052 / OCM 3 / 743B) TaxID=573061 RepID=D9SRY5_CLOC7|nr:preprotein translocase subunit SecG [Clostridium cellulovorans]ADL50502.1 preprotein translocase, SecG subunit [Clostridium cellulovorans 743B]